MRLQYGKPGENGYLNGEKRASRPRFRKAANPPSPPDSLPSIRATSLYFPINSRSYYSRTTNVCQGGNYRRTYLRKFLPYDTPLMFLRRLGNVHSFCG